MPDPRPKGPRLHLIRRTGRAPVYVIRDTGKRDRSTGTAERRRAEAQLAEYIRRSHADAETGRDPSVVTIAEVLTIYAQQHAPNVKAPERRGYSIEALLPYWGNRLVIEVKGATCREFVRRRTEGLDGRNRVQTSTARYDLGTLSAALRYCHAEGMITHAPRVTLPERTAPRLRYLTRQEAAYMLRAARRSPQSHHLARFILIGIYSGTRKTALLALGWEPQPTGGWIELRSGILYRRGSQEIETKKRRTSARLPRRLLAHAARWQKDGHPHVIHVDGRRVADIKTSWMSCREQAQILARRDGRDLDLSDVTPHTLKHTAVTWAMQNRMRLEDAAQYFGTTVDELQRTYWHHHPDFQQAAAEAMNRREAG